MTWTLKKSGTAAIIKVMPVNIADKLNNVRVMNQGKGTQNPPHADIRLPKSIRRVLWNTPEQKQ